MHYYLLQSFDLRLSLVHLLLSQLPFVQQLLSHPQFFVQAEQQVWSVVLLLAVVVFDCARADNASSIAEPAITNLRFITENFKN